MPAGPEETDNHPKGAITEQIAKNPSSKTDSTASTHPAHNEDLTAGQKEAFQATGANPGPVVSQDVNVQQEGTKEERRKKAEEMNK